MKRIAVLFAALLVCALIAYAAAGPTSYQVTGPVLEVKDDSITVQKGSEKWQIARDKDTKTTGDVKVGSNVTIRYTMRAASIEVKGGAEPKKEEPKKK